MTSRAWNNSIKLETGISPIRYRTQEERRTIFQCLGMTTSFEGHIEAANVDLLVFPKGNTWSRLKSMTDTSKCIREGGGLMDTVYLSCLWSHKFWFRISLLHWWWIPGIRVRNVWTCRIIWKCLNNSGNVVIRKSIMQPCLLFSSSSFCDLLEITLKLRWLN